MSTDCYPFHDWVETAQQEVAARGETPIQLRAALSLAEVAGPSREFEAEEAAENPDPDGKILPIFRRRISPAPRMDPAEKAN